jgi:hypothetical protein
LPASSLADAYACTRCSHAGGCSSGRSGGSARAGDIGATGLAADYSSRFAGFEAAAEPNGDLSRVVWPDFVTAGGPEVRRLYEFQVTHGELMRYMPCFCGCGQNAGHRNNRDCYVPSVNADGSVDLRFDGTHMRDLPWRHA